MKFAKKIGPDGWLQSTKKSPAVNVYQTGLFYLVNVDQPELFLVDVFLYMVDLKKSYLKVDIDQMEKSRMVNFDQAEKHRIIDVDQVEKCRHFSSIPAIFALSIPI